MFLNKPIKEYIIFFSMSFFTISLFACSGKTSPNKIILNNKTGFTLYTSKFETEDSDTEITLEEMESEKRIVLEINEKDLYYVSDYALLANSLVNIDIMWHVTDEGIDGKPSYKNQGKVFNVSDTEKGFCSYEIAIYNTHTEVRGLDEGLCDKKIILNEDF